MASSDACQQTKSRGRKGKEGEGRGDVRVCVRACVHALFHFDVPVGDHSTAALVGGARNARQVEEARLLPVRGLLVV